MQNFLSRTLRITALASLPATLMVISIPEAAIANPFRSCVSQLQDSGVLPENAAVACSDALKPKELSSCVKDIQMRTQVPAEAALDACFRTRRPKELAKCVTNINKILPSEGNSPDIASDEDNPIILALNTCQSSILPKRHAECVVGLSNSQEELSTVAAMETCISAENFPTDLFPAYVD